MKWITLKSLPNGTVIHDKDNGNSYAILGKYQKEGKMWIKIIDNETKEINSIQDYGNPVNSPYNNWETAEYHSIKTNVHFH